MTHPADVALTEHCPRPVGDPWYAPWWAKGEYARKNGTRWDFPDGTTVHGGQIVTRGHGRASTPVPVYQPHPAPASATETPRRAAPTPLKAPREMDAAARMVAECNGRSEKEALARRHGIDPAILDAPNAGVATMRLLNALRRVLNGQNT